MYFFYVPGTTTPPPVAANVSASTAYNTAVGIGVSASVTGSYATIVVDSASEGTATVSGSTINFTPANNTAAHSASITYHAVGPGGSSNVATITVSVAAYDPNPIGSTLDPASNGFGGSWVNLGGATDGVSYYADYVGSAPQTVNISDPNFVTPSSGPIGIPAGTWRFAWTQATISCTPYLYVTSITRIA